MYPTELKRLIKSIKTKDDMKYILTKYKRFCQSKHNFKIGKVIHVYDKFQTNYSYTLTGKKFDPEFKPAYTPRQMLMMGVFEGKYLNDCLLEFPREWFIDAFDKLSPEAPDATINKFRIKSRMSISEWIKRGWIIGDDPRGWFQWYCRYYLGRREPEIDKIQIGRWKRYVRHYQQIKKNCGRDMKCRPKQRQSLLQWSWKVR
ncbi:Uncharacterised protein [uncultured archaeon]|nr:Uncharacterised protein [uncultured archaeon]